MGNLWYPGVKEYPFTGYGGYGGGSASLSVRDVKFSPASEAGKTGADHYWDLGYTGGTDQNGNYDMTSYGTVTLEQTI